MTQQSRISTTLAAAMLQALIDAVDSGSVVNIYDGSVPGSVEEVLVDQNLLIELPLPYPTFGAIYDIADEVAANLLAVIALPAVAAGLATFFRVQNSSGDSVLQGTVGMLDCDLILGSTNVSAGVTVRINSWILRISKSQTVC